MKKICLVIWLCAVLSYCKQREFNPLSWPSPRVSGTPVSRVEEDDLISSAAEPGQGSKPGKWLGQLHDESRRTSALGQSLLNSNRSLQVPVRQTAGSSPHNNLDATSNRVGRRDLQTKVYNLDPALRMRRPTEPAEAHAHGRSRRMLYMWSTFKSTRYKNYAYGFPRQAKRIHFCFHKKAYKSGKFIHLPYQDELFLEMFKRCSKKKTDCTWSQMSSYKKWVMYLHGLYKGMNKPAWCLKKYVTGHNWEQLSMCYIFMQCQGKKGQPNFCPRPCDRDPCKDKAHTSTESCVQTNYGMYVDDFMCRCALNYAWNDQSRECERIDICKDQKLYPCNRENTQSCKLTEVGFICRCKKEYTGVTCRDLRNACLQNYETQKPTGAHACGVHGACKPIKGSNIYSCTCDEGWTDEPRNSWPDCSVKKDKCKKMLCHNGHCVASESQRTAVCVCDQGFGGKDCSQELPHWEAWAPWIECVPKCGNPRHRKRERACSKPKAVCRGSSVDYQSCAPSICLVPGVWAEWESWTLCSATCEGGKRVRTRECFYDTPHGEDHWGVPCAGPASATEDCHPEDCPVAAPPKPRGPDPTIVARQAQLRANLRSDGWKPWSKWGKCSVDCGVGEKSRTRKCTKKAKLCPGASYQVLSCTIPCEKYPYGPWSSWSRCTAGQTTCTRSRTCQLGPDKCQGSGLETENCVNSLCNGTDSMTVSAMERNMGMKDAALFAQTEGVAGIDGQTYLQSELQAELELDEEAEEDLEAEAADSKLSAALDTALENGQVSDEAGVKKPTETPRGSNLFLKLKKSLKSSKPVQIGSGVGLVVLLCAVVICCRVCCRKKKKTVLELEPRQDEGWDPDVAGESDKEPLLGQQDEISMLDELDVATVVDPIDDWRPETEKIYL